MVVLGVVLGVVLEVLGVVPEVLEVPEALGLVPPPFLLKSRLS